MTKRERLLDLIRISAYEGDQRNAMRLYVENRGIGYEAFRDAVALGQRQREAAERRQKS